jgi:hypothetical protein
MTTKPHNALYVRHNGQHYHENCLPHGYAIDGDDVYLNMNLRANIAQCLHVVCFVCQQVISLFPDRKQLVLRQWPDMTMPDVDQAVAFAQAAIGQLVLDDGKPYTVLHAWTVPPMGDRPGAVVAICELEEVEEEPEPVPTSPPPSIGPLARERYTPPLWTLHHIGSAKCWELIASARDDETIGIVVSSEADARLITEAPNMFALLKEFIEREETPYERQICECPLCEATRRLMQRVLGEA